MRSSDGMVTHQRLASITLDPELLHPSLLSAVRWRVETHTASQVQTHPLELILDSRSWETPLGGGGGGF